VQSSPATVSPSVVSAPVTSVEAARRREDRQTQVMMPRRSTRNPHLVEVNSHDGSGRASSSPSTSSCVHSPPVISDASNLSDEISQLLPSAGAGQMLVEDQLDLESSSLNSVQLSGQLAHYASETNLVTTANGSVPRSNQLHHGTHGRQGIGTAQSTVSAEYAQQLRRRSRSADHLSRQHKQKADSAAWSIVDIDTKAHTESTITDRAQQLDVQQKQSTSGQKPIDSLPAPFTTARLRPFRQQMNSVVVSLLSLMPGF